MHTSPEGCLRILGHGIALVQDDQLELVAAHEQHSSQLQGIPKALQQNLEL